MCIGNVTSHEFLMKSLDIFSTRVSGLVDTCSRSVWNMDGFLHCMIAV